MKIPVTIITGFLGAGKTSFINQCIQANKNKKFAVIENEFGAIGIDNELVQTVDSDIFELNNGCICCTLNDDLIEILQKLLEKGLVFDHLLIETTGIASPESIASVFLQVPSVQKYFNLDSIICICDAADILKNLDEFDEAKMQICSSDVILINKLDLIEENQLAGIQNQLQMANPLAEIIRSKDAALDNQILSRNSFDSKQVEQQITKQHKKGVSDLHQDHHHHFHKHKELITHSFIFDQPFDLLKLRHWMQVLLLLQSDRIYRVKGIIDVAENDHKFILQSVRKNYSMVLGEKWPDQQIRQSKIVFIGKNILKEPLEKQLKQLLSSPFPFQS